MASLFELRQSLVAYLSPQLCASAEVVLEYPSEYIKPTQKLGIVSVGLEKVSTVKGGQTFAGTSSEGELFAREMEITLRFDILCREAENCHRIFDLLCSALFLSQCPVEVTELWCRGISHSSSGGGFLLPAQAGTRSYAATLTEGADIGSFVVRTTKQST